MSEKANLFTCDVIRSILADPYGKTFGKDNRWLIYRMLQAMCKRQTLAEQSSQHTVESNGIGFNMFDAPVLTDIAQRSERYQNLTVKQAALVGRCLKKYIRQLCEIAGTPFESKKKVRKKKVHRIEKSCARSSAYADAKSNERLRRTYESIDDKRS